MDQDRIARIREMEEVYDLFEQAQTVPGAYYRHFRNKQLYRLLTFATIEATGEEAVVYQALYGEHRVWIRPKDNFFEEVLHEGQMVPRFQPVQVIQRQ